MPALHAGCMVAGDNHSLVVTAQGELLACGSNTHGQLGDGTLIDRQQLVSVLKEGVRAVAAGKGHSLAITEAGEVLAWGCNEDGLLGTGWTAKQLEPKKVIDESVLAVAAGWHHSLAVTEEGDLLAWGGNAYGQLGNGSKAPQRAPVRVALPGRVTAVAAGWHHSLALLESGEVLIWGFNAPDSSGYRTAGLPQLVLRHSIAAISAGGTHSLALTTTGLLLAWGANEKGQLGDGSASKQATPVLIASNITHASAGSHHSVAVDKENRLLVWGFNVYALPVRGGDLWRNEYKPCTLPMKWDSFSFHSASGGGSHSLAVSLDGEIFSWGGNASGQVGDGSTADAELPKLVLGPGTVQIISNKDRLAELMKGPAAVAEEEAPQGMLTQGGKKTRGTTEVVVPELMLRAAGVSDRRVLATTTMQSVPPPAPDLAIDDR